MFAQLPISIVWAFAGLIILVLLYALNETEDEIKSEIENNKIKSYEKEIFGKGY